MKGDKSILVGPVRTNLNFIRVIRVRKPAYSFEEAQRALHALCAEHKMADKRSGDWFETLEVSKDAPVSGLKEILQNVLAIRYIRNRPTNVKRWFRPLTENGLGQLQLGQPAYFDVVDMVWLHPSILMLRGPELIVDHAYRAFAARLALPPSMSFQTFDPQFLFSVLLAFLEGKKELTSRLKTDKPTAFRVRGIPEYTGKEISFEEVDAVLKSLAATASFLDGLGLSELKAVYLIDDKFLASVRVYSGGGFWVYLTDYLSKDSTLGTRLGISVLFIQRMLEAYDHWMNLSDDLKYATEETYAKLTRLVKRLLNERIQHGTQIRQAAKRRDTRRR